MNPTRMSAFLLLSAALAAITTPLLRLGNDDWIPVFLAFAFAVFLIGWVVDRIITRRRLRDWYAAEGIIESCEDDGCFKRTQAYRCAYVFRPSGARQGGTFLIYEPATYSDDRLDEVRKQLLGLTVRVRYNPKDCTSCIVEDKQVLDWDVVNS